MEKTKCRLCLNKEANQTGSHIFPHFLIQDAVNNPGKKGRGNEISFEMSTGSFANTYIGKSVLPADIKRVKGRDLTEEEIDLQKNHYTEDHILCSDCEKKLGTLESITNNQIFKQLRGRKAHPNLDIENIKINNSLLLRVFVYSLAWRAAIVNFGEFQMEVKHQEILRSIILDCIDIDEKKMLSNLKANEHRIKSLPLRVAFLETIGQNTNAVFCSFDKRPYSCIINDFCFQLFFTDQQTRFIQENFFGLTGILKRKEFNNKGEDETSLAFINDENRKKINWRLYSFIADKIMKSAINAFQKYFFFSTGRIAPREYIAYFVTEATINSDHVIEKYTPQHFHIIAQRVVAEYKRYL